MTVHVVPSEIVSAIESRISANLYDRDHVLSRMQIEELVRLASLAPSAYNLQNWRFIAVSSPEAKARLTDASYGQRKVLDAAVTFIIVGQFPSHEALARRLEPSVAAGFMPREMAESWVGVIADTFDGNASASHDEAIRSATFAASFLIFAAQSMGFASGAMTGFEAERVAREFGLGAGEVPVMLMTVGRAAEGNWPQKPRVPVAELIEHV